MRNNFMRSADFQMSRREYAVGIVDAHHNKVCAASFSDIQNSIAGIATLHERVWSNLDRVAPGYHLLQLIQSFGNRELLRFFATASFIRLADVN
jgi:hypothetical protein